MAAPEGNDFWKIRSKHGRDVLFDSPELLWEAACEYFEWCKKHPRYEIKAMSVSSGNGLGSAVEKVKLPKMRPFTLKGLCLYLGCSSSYFRAFKSLAPKSPKPLAYVQGILTVIEQIEETIFTQQYEGAAQGLLAGNIVSRGIGLVDKTDITTDGAKLPTNNVKVTVVSPPTED